MAEVAQTFRRKKGPLLAVVVANILLAAVALGVPAYRGRIVARESQTQFEAYVACLFGGEPLGHGGLGLPAGTDVRFAEQVLRADDSWPGTCDASLAAMPPPDATFLFPSIKRAGADVRTVVGMLREETVGLKALRAKGIGQVPERPLLILERLRAAMVLLAQAADTDENAKQDAIALPKESGLNSAARVPLMGRAGGPLWLWARPNGIEAVSADPIGISWLLLDDGRIDRRRARRSGLVRGLAVQDRTPYVIWATPERRCDELEDHCARRATGFAPLDRGSDTLPEPLWLAGHPAGRIDRSLRVEGKELVMLTRGSGPSGAEVRRFTLPEVVMGEGPPVSGHTVLSPPEAGTFADGLLLARRPALALFMQRAVNGALITTLVSEGREAQTLAAVEGKGAWSLSGSSCPDERGWAFAYGTETMFRLGFLPAASEPPPASPSVDAALPNPSPKAVLALQAPVARTTDREPAPLLPVLDRDASGLDRVRIMCRENGLQLLYIDGDHDLWSHTCRFAGDCGDPHRVARGVHAFDAVQHDGQSIYAVSGGSKAAQVRVILPGLREHVVPAPCWEPRRGFCGTPKLVSDGPRLLLAARDGVDLLMVESPNAGKSWQPMAGVRSRAPLTTDPTAPMRQHMIRKGLEPDY